MENNNININKKLFDLIETLRFNYGSYIGDKSLKKLVDLINGYTLCLYDLTGILSSFNNDMQCIIEKKYNDKTSHHWSEILCYYSETEENAFDYFYEFFDKYKELKETGNE